MWAIRVRKCSVGCRPTAYISVASISGADPDEARTCPDDDVYGPFNCECRVQESIELHASILSGIGYHVVFA